MSGALQAVFQNQRSFGPPPGQTQYVCAGTYSFVIPAGVTSISVLSVGAGRNGGSYGGGGGGALSFKNNLAVTPGQTLTVKVGCRGANACVSDSRVTYAGTRYAIAQGGSCFYGGTYSAGCGGGNGGYGGNGGCDSRAAGGGGAAGYTGPGGNGTTVQFAGTYATAGTGGGGGGGGRRSCSPATGGGGGGVGLLGPGANGAGGVSGTSPPTGSFPTAGGGGGSGGAQGGPAFIDPTDYNYSVGGYGGAYGGGGGKTQFGTQGAGGSGAVRIIWPGCSRSFPSTNVGNL